MTDPLQVGSTVVFEQQYLQELLRALVTRGYEVVGPTLREDAIVYDRLTSFDPGPACGMD